MCKTHNKTIRIKTGYQHSTNTHFNSVVFDVVMAGGTTKISCRQCAGSLTEANHLCFVKSFRCDNNQVMSMLLKRRIVLPTTSIKHRQHHLLAQQITAFLFFTVSKQTW